MTRDSTSQFRQSSTASMLFEALDENKDGYVDQAEASKISQLRFDIDQIDINHDRAISRQKWLEHQAKSRR